MGFRVPLPVGCRVFVKRNWEVVELEGTRSRLSGRDIGVCLGVGAAWVQRFARTVQRAAKRYPSADLTMVPAAIMAPRRS
jgi:hypothetical protein